MRIGLISDTHGHLDPQILANLEEVDEIWHAGDFGQFSVIETLKAMKPLYGVYGNIDEASIRHEFPENLIFERAGVKVLMTHIGGYPGRYNARVKNIIMAEKPDLYICGHSHILKVIPDQTYGLLHMNPGACGHHGFHKFRTMLRFDLKAGKVQNLEAIELGPRGRK